MKTLLCHAATFARIEDRLKAFEAVLQPICMDDDSQFHRPWHHGESDKPEPQPVDPGSFDIVFANTEVFFGPSIETFIQSVIKARHVGWIQSAAAGTEHPVLQAIGAKSEIYTSGHEQSPAIAEWVLWAAFDYFQNGAIRRAQQAGEAWRRVGFREIAGSRWLIIGYGTIGGETGRRLTALGAHVTGVRRRPGPAEGAAEMITPDRLYNALPHADGVVLCAPLTDVTRHMIGTKALAAMRSDALLINVGRGGLIDETALITALDAGEIGHAALDVVEIEPLPAGHPLWKHPKVTLTPHIAATTEGALLRTDALFLDNLERYLGGQPLRNTVDPGTFDQML